MKNKGIIIAIIVILLSSVSISAIKLSQSKVSKMKEAIVKTEEMKEIKDSKVIAKIGKREVKDIDIETVKLSYGLADIEISDEEALNKIIRSEVLYQAAIESGITISDSELDNYYVDMVEGLENSDETKEFLYALVDELGMNLDEYFESTKESTLRDLMISKFKRSVMSDYKEDKWSYDEYWNDYVEKIIKKSNIEKNLDS